jgi:hypothetical protein
VNPEFQNITDIENEKGKPFLYIKDDIVFNDNNTSLK